MNAIQADITTLAVDAIVRDGEDAPAHRLNIHGRTAK